MGKGKGEPDHWVAIVKPGTILFELAGVSEAGGSGLLQPRRAQVADAGASGGSVAGQLPDQRPLSVPELRHVSCGVEEWVARW